MSRIYNYETDGLFKCDECGEPVWEGDEFIRIGNQRICKHCFKEKIEVASWEDSDEAENINFKVHERIENEMEK